MSSLFSDRFRGGKILLTLVAIGVMVWYGVYDHPPVRGARAYLGSPAVYDGKSLTIGPDRVIAVHADGFTVEAGGLRRSIPLKVLTQDADVLHGIKPGEQVSVQGIFHRDGTLTMQAYHVNRGRDLKIIISVIPLILIAVLLARTYTISSWRIVLRTRSTDA